MTRSQKASLITIHQTPRDGEMLEIQPSLSSLFETIPPERVGLHGEYDYNGLAKRVSLVLSQHFEAVELDGLKVSQRGRVVILMGQVSSQRVLSRMIHLALEVYGTTYVEWTGVSIQENLQFQTTKLAS